MALAISRPFLLHYRAMNLRKVSAEGLGTAILVMSVVGSGKMAQNLSNDIGLQLVINSAATAAILYLLITTLSSISGAHFNPVVTGVFLFKRKIKAKEAMAYLVAQFFGALIGTGLANLMFDLPVYTTSTNVRSGSNLFLSEIIATAGLVGIIFMAVNQGREKKIPALVATWIGAGYFFTSSTSFANPAVTVARAFTDTFSGIAPESITAFIAAQIIGATLGYAITQGLTSKSGDKK
mgnify:CR=1 FL=1